MAVSKMEKMTIIAAAEKEAAILQAIQGLQIVNILFYKQNSQLNSYVNMKRCYNNCKSFFYF